MKAISTSEITERFLRFFEERGHRRVRSSSAVPEADPTLLFTNAGMNQFKDVFLGREEREYKRAVSAQKCLRAGGKHNDLEVVGFTGRHHTFFEMLGNFSFGDYFKEEAIKFGWEFLTEDLGLPKDRLWVSVFTDDDEAARIWASGIGVPEERILRLGEKDNFWQMGETGPCGPCSEIHFDQGDAVECEYEECRGVECECDRVVEIWNLVFMQYDRDSEGVLHPLPSPSIDTGMGLERLAAVLQNKTNNYDIDLFRMIIQEIESLCGISNDNATHDDLVSMRVVADHARATAFLVADGVLPASDGRGYVLRRIIRRAIRHGKRLGLEELFFFRVCKRVVQVMGEAYPELVEQESFISKVAEQEETSFRRTLDRGLKLLEDELGALSTQEALPGEVVFKLYDTYGFPLDLTQVISQERGLEIDVQGFERSLARQRASSTWVGSGEEAVSAIYKEISELHGETLFTGYERHEDESRVLAIVQGNKLVDRAGSGSRAELILDKTPFYGESGGQIGDTGMLSAEGVQFSVLDTKKQAGVHAHIGQVIQGEVAVGDIFLAQISSQRRHTIEANHSATHLLHKALKEVLGDHVKQAGSWVGADLLRFDYTTFDPPTKDQLDRVELRVNSMVRNNKPSSVEISDFDNARERGAVAMFGEKYGDEVRVVGVAGETLELCGGTHVSRSGDIGLVRIISDASIASGVRRIVASTGEEALQHVQEDSRRIREIATILKSTPQEAYKKAEALQVKLRELEREVDALNKRLATAKTTDVMEGVKEVDGIKVLALRTEVADAKALRDLADRLRDKMGEGVVVLGANKDGKALILAAVTRNLSDRVRASDIIREIAPIVGGRGGGKPDMAQAGGENPEKIDEALARVYDVLKSIQ